ncbi:MAG: septal ring lytic transglycosylase RlpA family protein [Geminicoccaceae bacterium]|nr:septal ring lytic transglycosylase RlpA family protein [Geminicoccaceae bacterium]
MPFGACLRAAAMVFLLAGLQACGGGDHPSPPRSGPESAAVGHYKVGDPYRINGRWYHPSFDPAYDETGVASWYGDAFQGRPTANGEVFDKNRISAAHTTLPLPSIVEVVNLENGRRLQLRVNDRGPFVGDRLIDLSEAAARELGFRERGLARVRVRFLQLADATGTPPTPVMAVRATPGSRKSAREKEVVTASLASPAGVTPVAAAPGRAPAAPSASCGTGAHFVQVAALGDAGRATAISRDLAQLGAVRIEDLEAAQGRLYRLRLGPLPSRSEAFDMLARLYRLGYQEAYVVAC